MTHFYLLPLFWLAGVLLYASSPRQQLTKKSGSAFSRQKALLILATILLLSLVVLLWQGKSIAIALLTLLVLSLFFIPMPVILLNHKPQWLKASIVVISVLAVTFQWLT